MHVHDLERYRSALGLTEQDISASVEPMGDHCSVDPDLLRGSAVARHGSAVRVEPRPMCRFSCAAQDVTGVDIATGDIVPAVLPPGCVCCCFDVRCSARPDSSAPSAGPRTDASQWHLITVLHAVLVAVILAWTVVQGMRASDAFFVKLGRPSVFFFEYLVNAPSDSSAPCQDALQAACFCSSRQSAAAVAGEAVRGTSAAEWAANPWAAHGAAWGAGGGPRCPCFAPNPCSKACDVMLRQTGNCAAQVFPYACECSVGPSGIDDCSATGLVVTPTDSLAAASPLMLGLTRCTSLYSSLAVIAEAAAVVGFLIVAVLCCAMVDAAPATAAGQAAGVGGPPTAQASMVPVSLIPGLRKARSGRSPDSSAGTPSPALSGAGVTPRRAARPRVSKYHGKASRRATHRGREPSGPEDRLLGDTQSMDFLAEPLSATPSSGMAPLSGIGSFTGDAPLSGAPAPPAAVGSAGRTPPGRLSLGGDYYRRDGPPPSTPLSEQLTSPHHVSRSMSRAAEPGAEGGRDRHPPAGRRATVAEATDGKEERRKRRRDRAAPEATEAEAAAETDPAGWFDLDDRMMRSRPAGQAANLHKGPPRRYVSEFSSAFLMSLPQVPKVELQRVLDGIATKDAVLFDLRDLDPVSAGPTGAASLRTVGSLATADGASVAHDGADDAGARSRRDADETAGGGSSRAALWSSLGLVLLGALLWGALLVTFGWIFYSLAGGRLCTQTGNLADTPVALAIDPSKSVLLERMPACTFSSEWRDRDPEGDVARAFSVVLLAVGLAGLVLLVDPLTVVPQLCCQLRNAYIVHPRRLSVLLRKREPATEAAVVAAAVCCPCTMIGAALRGLLPCLLGSEWQESDPSLLVAPGRWGGSVVLCCSPQWSCTSCCWVVRRPRICACGCCTAVCCFTPADERDDGSPTRILDEFAAEVEDAVIR